MRIGYEFQLAGDRTTGVGRVITCLFAALEKLDADLTVEVFASPRSKPLSNCCNRTIIHEQAFPGFNRFTRIVWQQYILPRLVRKSNLVLYHATGYVVSPKIPVPTVLSLYDTLALDAPELTKWENALHYRLLVPPSIRSAKAIIVPSGFVKRRVCDRFRGEDKRIHVIPLGVSPAFSPSDSQSSQGTRPGGRECSSLVRLLFVGNIEAKKNLGVIFDALSKLNEKEPGVYNLTIIGNKMRGADQILAPIRESGLEGSIEILGFVSDKQLVEFYRESDIFLFPSREEGFGLPVLEAMACGLPCVVSDSGALPEVFGKVAMVTQWNCSEKWRAAIRELASSEGQRRTMKEIGQRFAASFSWERTARETLEVYRETLLRHNPANGCSEP